MLKASLNNRLQCSTKRQSAQPVRTKPLFTLIIFGFFTLGKVAIFQVIGWFHPDPEGSLYYLVITMLLLCYCCDVHNVSITNLSLWTYIFLTYD